jgi:hypothetical protein
MSLTEEGASTGRDNDRAICSHELGKVEDFDKGSSPTRATAPPRGAVPETLA